MSDHDFTCHCKGCGRTFELTEYIGLDVPAIPVNRCPKCEQRRLAESHCKQTVIVVRNPDRALVLVTEKGWVVAATSSNMNAESTEDWIGRDEDEARLAACSLMRWWDESIGDNQYPEEVRI